MRMCRVAVVVAVLGSLTLTMAGPAQAKRILGSKGSDRIVGSAKADVIRAGGGDDRINGGRGRDRISGGRGRDRILGGRGADRLNAVDGLRDRLVRGGPGTDVCRVDSADRAIRGCETVKIVRRGGPRGGAPGLPAPGLPAPGAPSPGAPVPGPGVACATPPEDARYTPGGSAHMAGDLPPTFSDAFYATTLTLNVSADEIVGDQLPISIEEVCDVPAALLGEAAQLIGGEGVAIITPTTQVFDALGQQLAGAAATAALLDADSLSLKAQLLPVAQWGQDEDGESVPTFATSRADITD
jgi:Ca2+-binding RTX toxin-like protein